MADISRKGTESPRRLSGDLAGICAVLLLALAVRGTILITGQRYLRSDEAVVGMMAKHILTRGERPIFLYGQPYGGGHAIVAYVAAPLFAVFGRSAVLLTGLSAAVSLVNVWLLWLILRRYFSRAVALAATALYAFSPPVVYGAFLINGGTESFCLALLGLMCFLRAYLDGSAVLRNALLAGIFSGLAYYAMDYALLYPAVFVLLWLLTGNQDKWKALGLFIVGLLAGCLPLILYNATHDFAHLRHMFAPCGLRVGLVEHVFGALRHAATGGLAAFFGGDIDNYKPAGIGAWIHAAAVILAVAVLLREERAGLREAAKRFSLAGHRAAQLPAALIPVLFILLYMAMYAGAKFSLPPFRTPRYFLPLCPFVSVAVAIAAMRNRAGRLQAAGYILIGFLLIRGAFVSMDFGMRPWHEEHGIRTSGVDIRRLARWLKTHNIRTAFAPYEIQWRLMFETDEEILVSCRAISPKPRYPYYSREVMRRIRGGEAFALIARRDFRFIDWARGRSRNDSMQTTFRAALRKAGFSDQPCPMASAEFVVFYPLSSDLFTEPTNMR